MTVYSVLQLFGLVRGILFINNLHSYVFTKNQGFAPSWSTYFPCISNSYNKTGLFTGLKQAMYPKMDTLLVYYL